MNTKEKGYSLNVLVITIAVMLILTTTAIVTMRNLTSDKKITEFMSDLQEVEEFVKEYYSRKNTLPVVYEGQLPREVELTEAMEEQADINDKGKYYQVDLKKLGDLKLYDDGRGGYILNENTLNIYVVKPVEYQGVKYYTLTDELLGLDKTYGKADTFEINVTGNPATWVTEAKLMVSIPDRDDVNSNWSFKYYRDIRENRPITAEQFKTLGTFFEYGQPITIDANGIYSIYVENASGDAKVVNVVVDKIDEIEPYVYVKGDGTIVIGDDETGIRRVMYKIQNYEIGFEERASSDKNIETYFQGDRSHTGVQGAPWTLEEAYTGERINGITPSIGKDINSYKKDYADYVEARAELEELERLGTTVDYAELDIRYPQFSYNGVEYESDKRNIVLYVEDYAGNRSVSKLGNDLHLVSREMLESCDLIDNIVRPLTGANVIINDSAEYMNDLSREFSLSIKAQGATDMFITTDGELNPNVDTIAWIPFEIETTYTLPDDVDDGELELFVYLTSQQIEDGNLVYKRISDKIFFDITKPTKTAPEVEPIGNDLRLKVKCMQEDNGSGIDTKKTMYSYRISGDTDYEWLSTISNVTLEPMKTYEVQTKVTDKAGNTEESEVTTIQTPIQASRTLPNAPVLATGMKAIVWDGNLESPGNELEINPNTWTTIIGDDDVTWYNYKIGDGRTDTRDNIWANAKTSDGSYWVWIPRYAYRIIYYTDARMDTVKGYYQNSASKGIQYFKSDGITQANMPNDVKSEYAMIDIVFLNGTTNQYREENITTNITTIKNLSSEYIVHPAFQGIDNSTINNSLGRGDRAVSGIWVAKFEASRDDAKIDDEGIGAKVKSVPSVKSWSNISVSDAYKYCIESNLHLMKNSEWGAVAYLAHSPYGRNGNEISSNRATNYITGGGGRESAFPVTSSKFETTYAYNVRASVLTSGMYASTTGNIYGVYDMAGGLAEYTAAYLKNGNDIIDENGQELTQTNAPYLREEYTLEHDDQPVNNYANVYDIYGNAIYETSTHYAGADSINNDASVFPSGNKPFFLRGGNATSGSASGIFSFEAADGAASETVGFRPVLITY